MPYRDPEARRAYQWEYYRRRRARLRAEGRCEECGAIDGRIIGGRSWCCDCLDKWYARRGRYLDIVTFKTVPLEVLQ